MTQGQSQDKSQGHATGCVIAYTRVSTTEQGDSGAGLDAQRAAIEAEVSRRGWAPCCLVTDVASGKSMNGRPELGRALDALDRGEAKVLVVSKLDRLARSTVDFARIAERAERHGWNLIALDVNVDTTTASGRLMLDVVAAFASYERRLISDRTRAALQARKSQGQRLGRPVTLPDDIRARIVTARTGGETFAGIAAALNADGIATARGGARWYASSVRAVMMSIELDKVAA